MPASTNLIEIDVKKRKLEQTQQLSSICEKEKYYLQHCKQKAEKVYQDRVLQACK